MSESERKIVQIAVAVTAAEGTATLTEESLYALDSDGTIWSRDSVRQGWRPMAAPWDDLLDD